MTPRVALFADCFHEVNGVALTCRQLTAFAQRLELPFLSVRSGPATGHRQTGSVSALELARSAASIAVDADLSFDALFLCHRQRVLDTLEAFRPDVIHITGPGDIGILGTMMAHKLRVPLVASWHTNIHQFAARRLERTFALLPEAWRHSIAISAERNIFSAAMRYYSMARIILAPNPELASLIAARTRRPVALMRRGVDTELFSPRKRRNNGCFTLGFVGRLTPEKSVRLLADLEQALLREGAPPFRFLIAGDGSERAWLAAHLKNAEFTGVLKGEPLAQAYASMDAFVFPSRTDTYGNVVQEAMASGVPCLVTDSGGPSFLVEPGASGFICSNLRQFTDSALALIADAGLLQRMRERARLAACRASWHRVFSKVYEAYASVLAQAVPIAHNASVCDEVAIAD
jgi:glycosyltransferase involved in cell wall biosynthesis